jgi:hypothetical protein
VERRRWLRDLLAVSAGEFLAYRLDDLPLAWDRLKRLGYVFAELRQPAATTGWASTRHGNDDTLARQMIGQWLPRRLTPLEGCNGCSLRRGRFGCTLVLGGIGFEVFELQFTLG